jgi:hypothetical protein
VVWVLAGVGLALVLAGAPTAGLALALATVIGWSFGCLWRHVADDGSAPGGPAGRERVSPRPGESIRRYLRWLAEAE